MTLMETLSEAVQEYLESIYWLYESGIERTQAFVATQLNHVANVTGTAANMHVWARFAPLPGA